MECRPHIRVSFSADYDDRAGDVRAAAKAWDQRALVAYRAIAEQHPVDLAGMFGVCSAIDLVAGMNEEDAGIYLDRVLTQRERFEVFRDFAATADAADPGTPAVVEVGVAAMVDDPAAALVQAVESYRARHPGLPADWDLAPRRETENERNLDTIWLTVPYSALLL